MQKPQSCKQNWAEMKPTEGGRVCSQCEKTIVDFSNMKWQQIHNFQADRNFEICGFYNPKQLEYWGQEIPKKSCSSFAKSAAFISLMLSSELSMAQSQTTKVNDWTQIRTILLSSNYIAIANATILSQDNSVLGITNSSGEFILKVQHHELKKGISLIVKSPEISTKYAFVNENFEEGGELILKTIASSDSLSSKKGVIDLYPRIVEVSQLTTFYAANFEVEKTKNDSYWSKFKNWFRKLNQ